MKKVSSYKLGIDVGSTTIKAVVMHPDNGEILYTKYERHNAKQAETLLEMLKDISKEFKEAKFSAAVCGSGGKSIADYIGFNFVQEVVANSIAIAKFHPETGTAIELGGQDAKIIFFAKDENGNKNIVSDMRMNGVCAGGTGAFIDQVAELINVKTEEFGGLADKGKNVYEISGRCGVFAKTDIQPLLNQGISKEDIALSTFHAIAKQTIGGLAQGTDILAPVIFEGGPLTFNKRLIEVFKERLHLKDSEVIIPERPDVIVAYGAALAIDSIFKGRTKAYTGDEIVKLMTAYVDADRNVATLDIEALFKDEEEKQEFYKRHKSADFQPKQYKKGDTAEVYLGIDAGSTTTKFVLIDKEENIVDKFYANNSGEPLLVMKEALINIAEKYKDLGVKLIIKGVGTTGYGEFLFAKALKADYHNVETFAHAKAAFKYVPGVTFILDIGGQDMKAINVKNNIITGITLNEACSAGCGSFIETYAKSLKIPVWEIAEMAAKSDAPSKLGSRCTVFMNSSIITEQRNGKTVEDIMAGICNSIIENVFTKVIRASNLEFLGDTIVAQGGTFKNDAVLRALEKFTNRKIVRAPYPGEMGAIGIALLTKHHIEEIEAEGKEFESSFIGLDNLKEFSYEKATGSVCTFCQNNCSRTILTFDDGSYYVTGNRCEKGEVLGDINDEATREKLKEITELKAATPDLVKFRNAELFKKPEIKPITAKKNIKIGIPRVLEFWHSYPFWNTFFTALGYDVVISDRSTYKIFESGLKNIPSDTACFPAKLVHGHIKNLIDKKVDTIFMPMIFEMPPENKHSDESVNMCALIQGYPLIVRENDEPERSGVKLDAPVFRWFSNSLRDKQLSAFMKERFGDDSDLVKKAISEGDKAMKRFEKIMREEGQRVLDILEMENKFGIVLAGRPYHNDELINHGLSSLFTKYGIPVLTLEAIPDIHHKDVTKTRADTVNPFHTRLFSGAMYAAENKNLEFAQIVSFGCGHDAVNTDEITRLMREIADKEPLVLKLDEGEAKGPLNIRVKSFIETITEKRKNQIEFTAKEIGEPYVVKFEKKDKKEKIICIPNLSESFSYVIASAIKRQGYKTKILPIADERAKALGKIYVHNDICYPAQVNIGEMLAMLEVEKESPDVEKYAFGLAKNCDNCRAGQYAGLARKALDDAGYDHIPIITTGKDTRDMHPGFALGTGFQISMVYGMAVLDALEEMRLKMRPYEIEKGSVDRVFWKHIHRLADYLEKGTFGAAKILDEAITEFNGVQIDEKAKKPKVFIIGEILINFHPTANENIVRYLENNGMEPVLPSYIDFFRRDVIKTKEGTKRSHLPSPFINNIVADITDKIYERALAGVEARMVKFKYYEKRKSVHEIAKNIDNFIDKTYTIGEGWLIPAEIMEYAEKGVNAFVIIQPFGCLPNHITGRGLVKAMKKRYPAIRVVSIDYDPDTSFANIENRLQMLIMGAGEEEEI